MIDFNGFKLQWSGSVSSGHPAVKIDEAETKYGRESNKALDGGIPGVRRTWLDSPTDPPAARGDPERRCCELEAGAAGALIRTFSRLRTSAASMARRAMVSVATAVDRSREAISPRSRCEWRRRYARSRSARSHRVDDQEFYQLLDQGGISDDIHLFNEKLREWEDYYDYPHGALGGQTPYERLLTNTRAEVSPGS